MTDKQAQEIIDQLKKIDASVTLVFLALCGMTGIALGIIVYGG